MSLTKNILQDNTKSTLQLPILDNNFALDNEPEDIDFVLPGLMAGTVGALISPGGSGKSALALQLCAEVAGGAPLVGVEKTGKAVYLALEDPTVGIHHRFKTVCSIADEIQRQNLKDSERFAVYPWSNLPVDIMSEIWVNHIRQIAKGARLLVIDTLRKLHKANENDSGEMAEVVDKLLKIATETGCAIVYLHHTSKGASLNDGLAEQQSSRGSSVLVDNIRWQSFLRVMSEKEADSFGIAPEDRKSYVQYGVNKVNFGPAPRSIWLQRVSDPTPGIQGYTFKEVELVEERKGNNNKTKGRMKNVADF
tara:strand:+ start:1109 stop:2032 length:924 start_codon:yes stop_codon:yes gene_type:complete